VRERGASSYIRDAESSQQSTLTHGAFGQHVSAGIPRGVNFSAPLARAGFK